MKNVTIGVILLSLIFVFSCSDDTSTPSSEYAIKMQVTGAQNFEYKVKTASLVVPPADPNYKINALMTDAGGVHQFSMTLDTNWINRDTIDLSRDHNGGNIQFKGGTASAINYIITTGIFIPEIFTKTRVKGIIHFTAQNSTETPTTTVSVQNGVIDFTK